MFRTTLRSLWSHKRRLIATCLAIVLGIAFMSGTFVLNSTVGNIFDDLFGDLNQGVDAEVRGEATCESDFGTQRALLPADTTEKVAAVDGVKDAQGAVFTQTSSLLDSDGDVVGGFGPPTLVESWNPNDTLNAMDITEGREPRAAGEAVLNKAAADDGGYEVGDEITILTPDGREQFTLVGVTMFGDADSAGGSTLVDVTMEEAQRLTGQNGQLNSVVVQADEGVSQEQVARRLKEAKVAPNADIVTGQEAADEMSGDFKEGFSFFTTILTVFALIALFVGGFIISNTFGILIAQRTRELALLRALGAGRRQVLLSVLLEALLVGLFSAVVGFIVGIGLAAGALALVRGLGFDIPEGGLQIDPTTLVIAVIAGLAVTAVSAIVPAVRATRVPPIAALRDVAIDRSSRSKLRAGAGLLALVLGVLSVLPAFGDDPTTDDLPGIGIGLGLIILSVLLLGPAISRPLASLVGAPLPRLRGVTGRLARDNAIRNPGRTAGTASALIIGVTLVAFIMIFASSTQKSIRAEVDRGFTGDYIVQPANQFTMGGVSPELAARLEGVEGVQTVTALSFTDAKLTLPDGGEVGQAFVGGVDPDTFSQIFAIRMELGDLTDLGENGMIVDRQIADDKGLEVGDDIMLLAPKGENRRFTVQAISDDPTMLGQWTVTRDALASLTDKPLDFMLGLSLDGDTTVDEARSDLRAVVDDYPTMTLQDEDQFVGSIVRTISALLNFIYGLLAVSIVIAVIGIANTLSLSVHERTRELGLLRATGMSRSQLRASVRWEAAIVAVLGTGIGILLGVGLSWVLVKALVAQGLTTFSIPPVGLAVVVIGGALFGIGAALWPAWKASRLNVLDAIATE